MESDGPYEETDDGDVEENKEGFDMGLKRPGLALGTANESLALLLLLLPLLLVLKEEKLVVVLGL